MILEILEILDKEDLPKLEVLSVLLVIIDMITENDENTTALDVIITELIHLKHKDGIQRLLDEVDVLIDIANEEKISIEQMLSLIVVLVAQITKDYASIELEAVITQLTLLKYDRMGVLKIYEKTKVKELI